MKSKIILKSKNNLKSLNKNNFKYKSKINLNPKIIFKNNFKK